MTVTSNIPLDRSPQPYAAWATRRRAMPAFAMRLVTGAIIRSQSSLGSLALVVCLASGLGLLLVALLTAN